MNIGLILDLVAFIFISLACYCAFKIYRLCKGPYIWLALAFLYGSTLRGIHLLRNFIPTAVPSAAFTSRLFTLFYVLTFIGIMAYYKPLKQMLNRNEG